MTHDDPQVQALEDGLVARIQAQEVPALDDATLFAFVEGRLDPETLAEVRRSLVASPEARARLDEIRSFVEAPGAGNGDSADSPADFEAAQGWRDLQALLPPADVATHKRPMRRTRPWGLAALVASLVLAVGLAWWRPWVGPAVGPVADPAIQPATQISIVFGQRGTQERVEVPVGEWLGLELHHPSLPTECAAVEVRVRYPGGAEEVFEPEHVGVWLHLVFQPQGDGRYTIALDGCGVSAERSLEVVASPGAS